MAGGNFLGRMLGYVVNELVVEGLANRLARPCLYWARLWRKISIGPAQTQPAMKFLLACPTFQRFAVRTSRTLQDLSTKAEQTKQSLTEQIRDASRNFQSFRRQ